MDHTVNLLLVIGSIMLMVILALIFEEQILWKCFRRKLSKHGTTMINNLHIYNKHGQLEFEKWTHRHSSGKVVASKYNEDFTPISDIQRIEICNSIAEFARGADDYNDLKAVQSSEIMCRIYNIVDPSLNGPLSGDWVTSTFDGKLGKFNGVHNVSSRRLIKNLSLIFSKMLPLFEQQIGYSLANVDLPVYVKIENTICELGHLCDDILRIEGTKRERILAVGLYWVSVDSLIDNGNLQLALPDKNGVQMVPMTNSEDQDLFPYSGIYPKRITIEVKENTMFVFNNKELFHCMQSMKFNRFGQRLMVGFFLGEPWHRYKFTASSVDTLPKKYFPIDATHARRARDLNKKQHEQFVPIGMIRK